MLPQEMLERETPLDILSNLRKEWWVWRGLEIGVVVVVLKFHVYIIPDKFYPVLGSIYLKYPYLSISCSLRR